MEFLKRTTEIDVIGRMSAFGLFSGMLLVASLVSFALQGLNFGIDFAGGYEIQVKFPNDVSEGEIREVLKPVGVGDARVQRFGAVEDHEYLILVREHGTITDDTKNQLKTAFEQLAGDPDNIVNWSVAESGENVSVGFAIPIEESKVREILEAKGVTIKNVSRGDREDRPEYSVAVVSLADQIESALRSGMEVAADHELIRRVEFVGPQVGAQLRNQGLMAVVYALLFILLYVAIRFDLNFSPGAVVALIHDVVITLGVFSWFQLEFNLPIIAAILALVGYSLNDTIVVYDRIRENGRRLRGRGLRALVNTSINQTLSRTILTSITTLLVIAALLVFGGGIVRDFATALAIGVIIGTYSSVAVATPVYIFLRERQSDGSADTKGTAKAAA